MSNVDVIQLVIVGGFLFKVSLAIIGSFRGWKGWPWFMWLGVEISAGILMGFLEGSGLIAPALSLLTITGVGIITLLSLIYMACKRRYPLMPRTLVRN